MADRLLAFIGLAISIGYGLIAFTVIRAPFQYDPLGPETWPRILSVGAGLCCLYILLRPDQYRFSLKRLTLIRITLVILLLVLYARLYEPLGFILSTVLFCGLLSRMLGANWLKAGLFAIGTGIFGHILCVGLLNLNLPGGVLRHLLERLP